jgi:hypothetical protein
MILPTVLLRHRAYGRNPAVPAGTHYDWLMADPTDPGGRLWAGRVAMPSRDWGGLRSWDATPLPPHRRVYLTFEGLLGPGRGSVRRVDRGWFVPLQWTADQRVLDLCFSCCRGRVLLCRAGPDLWRARLLVPKKTDFATGSMSGVGYDQIVGLWSSLAHIRSRFR